MKIKFTIPLILVAILVTIPSWGQNESGSNFYDFINNFFSSRITDKNNMSGFEKHYLRMNHIYAPRLYPTGDARIAAGGYYGYFQDFNNGNIPSGISHHWEVFTKEQETLAQGNYTDNGIGQMHRIEFNPGYNINNKTIYATSMYGGLWRSYNAGKIWHNVNTDNQLPQVGVMDICIDPADSNNLFICTGDGDNDVQYSFGPSWYKVNPLFTSGIYRSTDNGMTWESINNGFITNFQQGGTTRKIVINPNNSNQIFCVTTEGVFRTNNALSTTPSWTKVFQVYGDKQFRGLEFKPGNPNTIYASGKDIYVSHNGGDSWQTVTGQNGLDFSSSYWNNKSINRINIDVSEADGSGLYAHISTTENGNNHSYIYIYKNKQWHELCNLGSPSVFRMKSPAWISIEASNQDADVVYFGFTKVKKIDANDLNNIVLIDYSSYSSKGFHADVHDLEFAPNTTDEILFAATHGGVNRSSGANNWTFRGEGLNTGILWDFDITPYDRRGLIVGYQDNGYKALLPEVNDYTKMEWLKVGGGDGYHANFIYDEDPLFAGGDPNGKPFYSNSDALNSLYPFVSADLWFELNDATNPNEDIRIVHTHQIKDNPVTNEPIYGLTELYSRQEKLYNINNSNTIHHKVESDLGKTITQQRERMIKDFEIAKSNPNFSYIVVGGFELAKNVTPRLFRGTIGLVDGISNFNNNSYFTDITSNLPTATTANGTSFTPVITGVAIDPKNADRAWVSFSGFEPTIKVYYTEDGGDTWQNADPNNYLYNIPVNDIKYQQGTDDRLYLATDVGIFTKDNNSANWQRLGDLPNVRVIEIKINYCSGELVAGTFGRGVWKSKLLPYESLDHNWEVNNSQTWSRDTIADGNVIVNAGAVLTITGNAYFNKHAKMIVKPNAQLIIDGGTLSNRCKELWGGVEVWGNHDQSQLNRDQNNLPKYQGELIVKNGGSIRNASDAIKAIKVNDDGSYDWSKTGGIVRLNDAELINNKSGVWIGGYHNFHPINGRELPNSGKIINSHFETNNNFLSGYAPYEFIGLFATDKVHIRGNTFVNKNTSLSGEDKGRGIMSYNASFTADRLCTSGTTPCSNYKRNTFKRLFLGIYHSNLGGDDIVSIKNNDFVNCNKSIFLNNSFSTEVINNDIQVGDPAYPDVPHGYGIYLNSGKGFKIEENKIYPYDQMGGGPTFGIVVNNTGENNNELYKNEFNGLNVAINPLNCNRDSSFNSNNVGLKLSCNENSNPMYDIWVSVDDKYEGSPAAGISSTQKIKRNGNFKPVNNIFSSRNSYAPYDIDASDANHINYYYEAGASVKYKPNPNNIDNVTLYPDFNNHNNCPSQTNPSGLSQLYTDLSNAQVALNSSQTILNIWKDGGDADLNEDIELIEPWEVYNEFNNLMAESPYLSDESLIAVIENPAFTAQMVKLLMIANPQSVNSDPVMDALYDRNPPLPQSYIDEILQEEGTESQLEKLEDNVAADYHNLRMIGENIKRHYRKDTSHTWAKDSLIDFVSRQDKLEDRYELASIYLEYGQYNNMNACLSNIPQEFELTQEESTNHSNFVTVFNIAENVYSDGMHIGELTSSQITSLENVLDLQRPMLTPMALTILKMNNPQYNYQELVLLPDTLPEGQMVEPEGFVKKNKKEKTFKVYPNPAHDYITVAYRTSDMEYKSLYIRIFNAQGKLVLNEDLKGGDDEELLGLSSLRSGSYIVKLLADKKELAQEKLSIVK